MAALLTTTSRFTPCRFMAAMMLVVPSEYTLIGLRLYETPSADRTASPSAMAASTMSASATSAPKTATRMGSLLMFVQALWFEAHRPGLPPAAPAAARARRHRQQPTHPPAGR